MNNAIRTAVIVAGGLETRGDSGLPEGPAALAPVGDRPFLAYLLEQLEATEVRRVILCTGQSGPSIQQAFGADFGRLQLDYRHEALPLGTAGAVARAAELCDDPAVLVLNGNSYCRFDPASLRRFHESRRAAATMLVAPPSEADPAHPIYRDPHGAVVGKNAQLQSRGRVSMAVSAGIYLLDRRLLGGIAADRPASLERDILPQWIGRGLFAHRTAGPFIDLGTPHAYGHAKVFFAVEQAA